MKVSELSLGDKTTNKDKVTISTNYKKHTSKNPLFRLFNNRFLKTICELSALANPESILDAGCGEGFVIERLLQQLKAEIQGLDLEETALKIAQQQNPGVTFLQGDVCKLPFENNSFDLVILCEVLEHLTDPQRALQEVKKVSRKYCLISVPNEPLWRVGNVLRLKYLKNFGNTPGHINHWSKKAFIDLVKKHFSVDEVRTSFPWTIALCKINNEQ